MESVLTAAGFEVEVETSEMHNTVIVSIRKEGRELIPHDDPKVTFGYDDARGHLLAEVVTLLDQELG